MAWTGEYVDPADRTTVREVPDETALKALPDREAPGCGCCWTACPTRSSSPTADVAGLRGAEAGPGMRLDDPPTEEVKADQKEFFGLLYRLLVDAERGPRLPTLFMALGADRVRALLAAMPAPASAAVGLESRRNVEQRSHSSCSPIARAARASSARQRRNPRFGSCSQGTGP